MKSFLKGILFTGCCISLFVAFVNFIIAIATIFEIHKEGFLVLFLLFGILTYVMYFIVFNTLRKMYIRVVLKEEFGMGDVMVNLFIHDYSILDNILHKYTKSEISAYISLMESYKDRIQSFHGDLVEKYFDLIFSREEVR